ncbi:MAG: AraC family transcriptional regulator [Lachnospiraceae bacterium]|nr:AraC family transcriptional regulator [Lachnospiraceae bacterium]
MNPDRRRMHRQIQHDAQSCSLTQVHDLVKPLEGVDAVFRFKSVPAPTSTEEIPLPSFIVKAFSDPKIMCTDLTIEQIAWKVGFQDVSSLHVRFSKIYHMTPGQYRAANQY